ncbi:hypothetical protein [Vibrio sp. SCSIO 43136]|uniref:hypothetical protein n=1 Tax=Vibrio sp. SCSIO 43136 TaxID=2819101 RepID=UPI002075B0F6|nr:hypothetical protein [Vibrio sp. SCSIO 43136]USD65890.1 hypothetical protein J4N39_03450 [Vibrio sp. SCSIO 43136]
MLTKDVTEEITNAIESISAQGKEPSIALIRARLTSNVPMPAIISVLKSWKSSARVPKVEIATQAAAQSPEQRIAELESQVKALTQRIEALEKNA